MREFTLSLAGLNVGVESRFDLLYRLSGDYLTEAVPDFAIRADASGMEQTRQEIGTPITEEDAEFMCLHREMAEKMACFDRWLIHGAAVCVDGRGYLFCAPSGTGKSTHISLWRELLGDKMTVINGDKPFLRRQNGKILVCGSPYAGKEGWNTAQSIPLAGVCILSRGQENTIRRLSPHEALSAIIPSLYYPRQGRQTAGYAAILRDLAKLPCYDLVCNISMEAAQLSIRTMTGRLPEQETI